MHEFEFEVRISDQIQTVKNGKLGDIEILFEYYEFLLAENCPVAENSRSTHAKFEVRTRKTDGFYSAPSDGIACSIQPYALCACVISQYITIGGITQL
jgi:hypothetical protein